MPSAFMFSICMLPLMIVTLCHEDNFILASLAVKTGLHAESSADAFADANNSSAPTQVPLIFISAPS